MAYADFVTAMMAFFMLMWLLNATTEQQRKGIADYFSPTFAINRTSGGGDSSFVGDSVFTENTLTRQGIGASTIHPTESIGARGATGFDDDGVEQDEAMDASDYSTQLATFSGVEQQVQTNDLLKQIQAKLTQSDLVSMSHWVGKQVEIPDNVNFSGDAAEIRAFLPDGATHGNVEILSASGTVIKKITLDSGESKVSWDGTDQNGTAVTYGTYSARLVPYDGETEMDHQSVYAYHSVNEVSVQNGQAVLGLTDGNYIYTDMVTALRL